jgi:hypothetical protein
MLTIGITGHRILCETDKITGALDQVMWAIKAAFPSEAYTLLSSLAEGADRLAAECALKQGIHLITPLPLPKKDYLTDFVTQESKLAFETLLSQAQTMIELPNLPTRNASYEAAGYYILEHCDVLIAIWDGRSAQGQGGTGDMIVQARQRGLPLAWIHAGNRKSGTLEPTSLGKEQGKVDFLGHFWNARIL